MAVERTEFLSGICGPDGCVAKESRVGGRYLTAEPLCVEVSNAPGTRIPRRKIDHATNFGLNSNNHARGFPIFRKSVWSRQRRLKGLFSAGPISRRARLQSALAATHIGLSA